MSEIKKFFSSLVPPKPPKHDEEEIIKKVVSLVGKDEICLYFGRFITKRDIDERKKRLLGHNFKGE